MSRVQFPDRNGSWNDYSHFNNMTDDELRSVKAAIVKRMAGKNRKGEWLNSSASLDRAWFPLKQSVCRVIRLKLLAVRLALRELTVAEYRTKCDAENF